MFVFLGLDVGVGVETSGHEKTRASAMPDRVFRVEVVLGRASLTGSGPGLSSPGSESASLADTDLPLRAIPVCH